MVDKAFDDVFEVEDFWVSVDDGDVVDAEAGLEGCVFEEVVEHDVWDAVFADLDDDSDASVEIGFVSDVDDAVDFLGRCHLCDFGDHVGFDDHEWYLLYDDALSSVDGLDVVFGAQDDSAFACEVGVADAGVADDCGSSGEVGRFDDFDELLDVDVWVLDVGDAGVDCVFDVVGGHERCHADGDSRRAVD